MGKSSVIVRLALRLLAVTCLAPAAMPLVSPTVARRGALAAPDLLPAVKKRASKLAKVAASVAGVEPRESTLGIRVVTGAEELPVGADPRHLGWYAAEEHELVVQIDVKASVDQALFALVEAELRRGLGEPGAPWFARGVAYALIGSAGGLKLTEIEARTEEVTPLEVFNGAGRPAMTLAPAEARLARCLMVELGVGISDAWKVEAPGAAATAARLDAAWANSLEVSGISPLLEYPRSIQSGTYVAFGTQVAALAPEAWRSELTRIASLGARGVELPVVVNLPGAGAVGAGEEPPISMIEGGAGPIVRAALFAREHGLSVVLAPRFMPLLTPEEQSSPAAVEAHGQRRQIAVEALSWLAEFALADGLVLFEGEELLQPAESDLGADLRAARTLLRRRSLVSSRPFAGDRLAWAPSDAGLMSARSEDFSADFRGALAVINLKVGLQGDDSRLGLTRVGPWRAEDATGDGGESPGSLRSLGDEALTELLRAEGDR